MDVGAAGVMIAPPNTLRTDEQIVGYYRQAVKAIGDDIPWAIQDYPLNFSVIMTPEVVRTIVNDNPTCVMVKHEDWPGLEKISAFRAWQSEGTMRPVSILCGNGGLFLDFETERGANGAMTGYAFPDMLVDVVRMQAGGARDAAHDLFDAHLPLLRYEQQPRTRSCGPQIRDGQARHDRVRRPARARHPAQHGGQSRGRLFAVAACAQGPARGGPGRLERLPLTPAEPASIVTTP